MSNHMLVSPEIENLIKPRTYVKPTLEFGEHVWEWNKSSYGIRKQEKNELTFFIKNSISVLGYLLKEIERLENVIEKNKKLDKHTLAGDIFSPYIHLTHLPRLKGHADVMYIMEFTWDKQIFVDRHEGIMVESGKSIRIEKVLRPTHYHSQLHLSWNLGQFFFNENSV